jgi:hypothetical protein
MIKIKAVSRAIGIYIARTLASKSAPKNQPKYAKHPKKTGMLLVFVALAYILSLSFWAKPIIKNKIINLKKK